MGEIDEKKCTGTFIVENDKGLHTRPCAELVKCAGSFRSHITFRFKNMTVSSKSLLGILTLGAAKGSEIGIEAVGIDAEEAVAKLIELAKKKFYTTY